MEPGLISKRRGRPGNRRKPEAPRSQAPAIIRERYRDFGPTLAVEKLREVHGIALGRDTSLINHQPVLGGDTNCRFGNAYH